MYEEALGLFHAAQHSWGVGLVRMCFGEMFMERGELAKAEVVLQENLSLFRWLDWWFLSDALYMLVGAALAEGDLTRAKALAQHRLAIGREDGQIRMCCRALRELGHVALQEGDYQRAMALFDECIALFRKAGYAETSITHTLADLGFVAQIQGDYETATRRFNEALEFYQDTGKGASIGHVQACLGYIALAQGDLSNAFTRFHESVRQFHKIGYVGGVAVASAGMSRIAQAQGQAQQAAKLCGFAAKFNPMMRVNCMPVELAGYERILADAQSRLDDPELAEAWEEGAAMTLDQAVAFALANE
jgi:tetratricopeptide (TPR) repeat protein